MPKTKRARRYTVSPYEELEMDLNSWVIELRSSGLILTRMAIRTRALQLSMDKDKYHITGKFVASAGWCTRFMNRNGLVLRQRTHIAQKLPKDLDDKVDKFHRFVIDERKLCAYAMSAIGNMDESPMYFDMPGNTTVDFSGNKTISIKTTGHEKQHFTVVLACLADRTKLKPMVIFKRKTMPKDKFPSGVLVKVQEKGWMNESLTHTWLDEIWFKRSGSLVKPTSLLVWDQFRAHLCESVKKKLHRNKT